MTKILVSSCPDSTKIGTGPPQIDCPMSGPVPVSPPPGSKSPGSSWMACLASTFKISRSSLVIVVRFYMLFEISSSLAVPSSSSINPTKVRCELLAENQVVGSDGLKPDLVFRKGRYIFIIDVACPFENRPKALEDARKEKCDKYASLLPFYSSRGYNPVIIPIIVGALGSWDPKNDSFLSKHMSKSYLHKFRQLCVSETVKWSRDIYVQHITGKKQYEENGQDFEDQQPQGPQTYFEYINSQV
ncbi:hypothetical protein AVEN_7642-1 [Araneus ventricosus]|uniref:Uncharacterized protein n=1 Tax=Araneus ventricosus TaxID=182803 RepID=A0A4Y2T1N4_ARAVE|nr:hypothetical protein AVEN_7642-1 [Araneus ventricosus]